MSTESSARVSKAQLSLQNSPIQSSSSPNQNPENLCKKQPHKILYLPITNEQHQQQKNPKRISIFNCLKTTEQEENVQQLGKTSLSVLRGRVAQFFSSHDHHGFLYLARDVAHKVFACFGHIHMGDLQLKDLKLLLCPKCLTLRPKICLLI